MSDTATDDKLPLLIFGIGPVLDSITRIKAEESNTVWRNEDVPFWSHNLAIAAAQLYQSGVSHQMVVMGGQTGGKMYRSESELIKDLLVKMDVPEYLIYLEKNSQETIENIVNFLNEFNDRDSDPSKLQVNILCAEYHAPRTALLMKFFGIRVENIFASEEIIRYVAHSENAKISSTEMTEATREKNNDILNTLDAILDPGNQHSFYNDQKGIEKITYLDHIVLEGFWTREILTMPERILFQAAGIENNLQIREIIKIAQKVYGDAITKYDFDLTLDTPDDLRAKMKRFPWPYIVEGKTQEELRIMEEEKRKAYKDKWIEEYRASGWPQIVFDNEEKLRNYKLYETD